ncbi:MAG: DUF4124 domain-containing protein [Gammaproteobacteria bacterium]|nr:DUF4124 domain-containing protein [Gammaproteobacteria bacterium]
MLRTVLAGLLIAGLAAGAAAETIYKWSDARGQIYYTDLPPRQPDATVLAVYENEVILDENGEVVADSGEPPAEPPATTTSGPPPVPAATASAMQADLQETRTRLCKEAQERYRLYLESQRLYRTTPDGERQYLTDDELNEARLRARQAVDEYCGAAR